MKKMQRCCWIIFFVGLTSMANAQSVRIDSLKNALANGNETYFVLWGLAYELFDVDNEQALFYARRAQKNALQIGDTFKIVKSGRLLGQLLRRNAKPVDAVRILETVLPMARKANQNKEAAIILNSLAVASIYLGEYDKALAYNFEALVIREQLDDKSDIGGTLQNIGLTYYRLGYFSRALEYYSKALQIRRQLNNVFDVQVLLTNIGLCYAYTSNQEKARASIYEAAGLCKQNCNEEIPALVEFALGVSYEQTGDYQSAKLHFERSLKISERNPYILHHLESLMELSKIHLRERNLDSALKYLREIESLPDRRQYSTINVSFLEIKAQLYTIKGDFEKANLYRKRYAELKDSVYSDQTKVNLMRIESQFAERRNLAKLDQQSQVLLLQAEAIRNQRILNIVIGIVMLLGCASLVLLYKLNKQKQMANRILDLRVRERTRELELNRDELKHAHDEQDLIIKKVSTDLNSSLATMKGLSNLASKELPLEKAIYFKEVETTTEKLVNLVNRFSK